MFGVGAINELSLQTRVDRFAFQYQNAEDTFMNTGQRFMSGKAIERFNAESKPRSASARFLDKACLGNLYILFRWCEAHGIRC
jgi:hypothetical protein